MPPVFQVTTALEVRVATFVLPHVQIQVVIHGRGEDIERTLQGIPGVSGLEFKAEQ